MSLFSPLAEGRRPDIRCASCPIVEKSICSHSSKAELSILEAIKSYRTYLPGEEIVAMDEAMATVGSVVAGIVSLTRLLPDGRRQMVGLLFPGDFVGRVGRATAPYDAVAVDTVTLCQFDRRRFERVLDGSPDLRRRLLEMTLDELDAAREWMVVLGRKTAREKLASFLCIVAGRSAGLRLSEPADGIRFALPLTREATADYLGLTIETVSRQIGAMRKDGLIVLEDARRVRVPDYARLRAEAGEEA